MITNAHTRFRAPTIVARYRRHWRISRALSRAYATFASQHPRWA
jgi:hypothetical protein